MEVELGTNHPALFSVHTRITDVIDQSFEKTDEVLGLCFYLQLHFSAIWTRVLAEKTRWNRIDALIFLMINNLARRRKATTTRQKKKKNDRLSAGDVVCRHLLVFFRLRYIRFPFLLSSH